MKLIRGDIYKCQLSEDEMMWYISRAHKSEGGEHYRKDEGKERKRRELQQPQWLRKIELFSFYIYSYSPYGLENIIFNLYMIKSVLETR